MAIDTNRLTSLIDELGLSPEDAAYLTKSLTNPANETQATRFISQRERHDDYTRRTQALATDRANLERTANDKVAAYQQQLNDADARIRQVVDDFEKARISAATAEARLQKVKLTYGLSDQDIPPIDPVTPSANANQPPAGLSEDRVLQLLTKFRTDLINDLKPELQSFPKVAAVMGDIARRHFELTGKHLSLDEQNDIIKTSSGENGPTLINAWRDKYKIGDIEKSREREEWSRQDRIKWEDERKAQASKDAMSGVSRNADTSYQAESPVLNRRYDEHHDSADRFTSTDPTRSTPVTPVTPPTPPAGDYRFNPDGTKRSGAERAAVRFLERRNQGIPMGKEAPVGSK
jgi:hypothetical protein